MSSSASSSLAHAVRMSAGTRQFLRSHVEAEQRDVMIPALQVSVKLSGHLITIRAWEGALALVAKNSAGNEYTLSAQLVLDQMLGREAIIGLIKAMEDANICLSFECITAFNGDHGYPKRSAVDVMICTAIHTVTELGPSDPWTNVSLFNFCRSHGLPCNQCLYALDEAAAMSVFDAYRGMCHQFAPHTAQLESMFETFTTHHQCVALESFPHKYISDVVEGFVVRSTMLPREEIQILLTVEKEDPMPMDLGRLLSHNLRRTVNDECGYMLDFQHAVNIWEKRTRDEGGGFPTVRLENVGKIRDNLGRKIATPKATSKPKLPRGISCEKANGMMDILKGLLDPPDALSSGITVAKDTQTQFVQSVLKTCVELGIKVNASFYSAERRRKELDLVILHVKYDSHHFKFHRHAESAAGRMGVPLALYRGFAIRLMKNNNTTTTNGDAEMENGIIISAEVFANFYPKFDNATQEDSKKLITDLWEKRKPGGIRKFKFSYYKYATMLCRSLLETGRVSSHPKNVSLQKWELKCRTTLTKWGMKPNDQVPYLLRLLSWHAYVQRMKNKDMLSSTYITPFMQFVSEEESWHKIVEKHVKSTRSVLSRAVYVISPESHIKYHERGTEEKNVTYANSLAEKLGVECVDLAEKSTNVKGSTSQKNHQQQESSKTKKKNKKQKHIQQQENSMAYIDDHLNGKIVMVSSCSASSSVFESKCGGYSSSKTLNNEQISGSIPILPRNAMVNDEAAALIDFCGISALPEGVLKSSFNQWVTLFQDCKSKIWDMRQHPPGNIAESLLEMESEIVQPILIFPCGIPGSGKSAFGRFLCRYGVKLVCSDDKSVPKRNKRSYDALIERKLKPYTLRRPSQQRGTSDELSTAGEEEEGVGVPHTLSAVYRDKNASSDQFSDIIKSVSTRVVAIVFGGSQKKGGLDVERWTKSIGSPPMTDWEIAVCMRRMLLRQNHEGGLDATLNIALRVVMGFAKRYTCSFSTKGIFMDHLKSLCGEDNVLSIPICKDDQFHLNVPREIAQLLKEGWKSKKLSDSWEAKLRDVLRQHDAKLKSMEVETSSDIFGNAINDALSSLLDISKNESGSTAAVFSDLQCNAVAPDSVTDLFVKATMQQAVATSLSDALRDIKVSEELKVNGVKSSPLRSPPAYRHLYQVTLNEKEFVPYILSSVPELSDWLQEQSLSFPTKGEDTSKKYHVTLAFIKRSDRAKLAETSSALDQLVGSGVKVSVSSCACDGKAAALIVCAMDPSNVRSLNRIPHVTLSTAKNVSSRHSNEMLECGNYKELKFRYSISFTGLVTTSC